MRAVLIDWGRYSKYAFLHNHWPLSDSAISIFKGH